MKLLSTIQKPREVGDITKETEKKIQRSSEMELKDELALAKQRIMKRRIMEAQVQQGGGEVRRVHVIYFLSRKGRVEHPHLIRVHHLSRNGVRLRDVKRWLSELRGKDMPESFAWSYKRKYKAGYVWQDLLDEDLITPISDNEYVLKGSEIASTTFNNDKCSYGEKQASNPKKSTSQEVEGSKEDKTSSNEETQKNPESPLGISPKTSCEIEQESPLFGSETSSLTDDSTKLEKDKKSSTTKQEEEQNGQKDKKKNTSDHEDKNNDKEGDNVNSSSTSFKKSSAPNCSAGKSSSGNSVGAKQSSDHEDKNNDKEGDNVNSSSTSFKNSSAPNCSAGKSSSGNSGGAKQSNMFRNWITCGTVEANESAVMVINRRNRTSLGVFSNKEKNYKGEIFKGDNLGGSERMAAHSWLLEQHHEATSARKSFDDRRGSAKSNDEFSERKTISAAYKPINRPKCSQCGRQFKPEKLHAHMKSCRGMKAMAKSSSTACPRTSDKTTQDDSASSFYLTNK